MNNEKRAPGCLGKNIRDVTTTQLCGDCFINHYKRIHIKGPGKAGFSSWLKWVVQPPQGELLACYSRLRLHPLVDIEWRVSTLNKKIAWGLTGEDRVS